MFFSVRRFNVVHLQRRRGRFRRFDVAEEVEGQPQRSGHQGRVHEVGLRRRGRSPRTCDEEKGRGRPLLFVKS